MNETQLKLFLNSIKSSRTELAKLQYKKRYHLNPSESSVSYRKLIHKIADIENELKQKLKIADVLMNCIENKQLKLIFKEFYIDGEPIAKISYLMFFTKQTIYRYLHKAVQQMIPMWENLKAENIML